MKNLYAAIAATVIGLPVPVEASEPIELGYFLPRTAITVTVKQRLEACPKGGDDLNDFITTTVAVEHKAEPAKSSGIYGGIPGGPTADATAFIETIMASMMDEQQSLPPLS